MAMWPSIAWFSVFLDTKSRLIVDSRPFLFRILCKITGSTGDCGISVLTKTVMVVPTPSGNMATVDSKGRIVLPQEVRERLGITPGTEVDIHEEDGKAVVEPEDGPDEILERMDQLVAETSSERGETTPLTERPDPIAQKHRDAVRKGAEKNSDE